MDDTFQVNRDVILQPCGIPLLKIPSSNNTGRYEPELEDAIAGKLRTLDQTASWAKWNIHEVGNCFFPHVF